MIKSIGIFNLWIVYDICKSILLSKVHFYSLNLIELI